MVAVIDTSATLSDVLNYNEKKVAHNDATLIHASGFLKDFSRLTFHEKEDRFTRQNQLKPNSKSNTLHASLNFDPSEQLSDAIMARIADRYMQGLGMQDRPYLVYRHTDAGHPHIHIVSTLIDAKGQRLNTNNIGRNQSTIARKEIEKEFGLIVANSRQRREVYQVKPVDVEKVRYGNEHQTKHAMRNVLLMAHQNYKFTSLPEYNAVLRQWNVLADRGGKDSRIYKRGGLVYRVLDEQGKKVGVPIKASDYYFKPTLANLQIKFAEHKVAREKDLKKIQQKIADVLAQKPDSLSAFTDLLSAKNIEAVVYRGQADQIFGITYVDNDLRVAVKGSDLGKAYSVAALLKALDPAQAQVPQPRMQQTQQAAPNNAATTTPQDAKPSVLEQSPLSLNVPQLLSQLAEYDPAHGSNPHELQQDDQPRKRKKR
jgi:hypothetical protein